MLTQTARCGWMRQSHSSTLCTVMLSMLCEWHRGIFGVAFLQWLFARCITRTWACGQTVWLHPWLLWLLKFRLQLGTCEDHSYRIYMFGDRVTTSCRQCQWFRWQYLLTWIQNWEVIETQRHERSVWQAIQMLVRSDCWNLLVFVSMLVLRHCVKKVCNHAACFRTVEELCKYLVSSTSSVLCVACTLHVLFIEQSTMQLHSSVCVGKTIGARVAV